MAGNRKRKLHKITIKHASIPFRICPSAPVLVEIDTNDDLIPNYEVEIKLEYKEEKDNTTHESVVSAIFREEMKKQSDLDNLMVPRHRGDSETSTISKGDGEDTITDFDLTNEDLFERDI